jgi:gliding motility-associated-like protein
MRIITLIKKYFFYTILFLFLFGVNNVAYSQCPTVVNANQSFCDTQSPTIGDLVVTDNGGGIKWYATATSTTVLTSTIALQNGEDYFADDNTGSCGTRQSVIVTIYSAPIADPFQGPCVENLSDATLAAFTAIGNNIQWYATSTGGSPLPLTTIIVNGTIYYASQTNPDTGCETSRRAVRAVVGYVPTPTGPAIQNFCNISGAAPTVNDLVASGNNNWYLNSFSSVPLSLSTPLINGHTYYATTIDPPCESTNRFAVLVNIYQPNNSGSGGQKGICVDQISTTAPFDLFNLLGGTPDNTGIWSGPIATSNGYQGTLNVSTMTLAGSPYVFTYTVSNPSCANATSTVTITINPLPTVTVTSPPVCSSTLATVTAIPSPSGTYNYIWTVPSGVTNPGNVSNFTTAIAGNYSVVITNTATSCSSLLASTTVVINQVPTVTVNSPPVCVGTSATVTATPNPSGTYNYAWTVPSGVTNPGNVSTFTTSIAGVYSVIITNTITNCLSQPASTTVVINPIPTVTVSSPPVCSGTLATVTATPNPLGTYTYIWTVPSGTTNPGNVASFTTSTPGVYTVVATNTATTCPSQSASATVVINQTPTVTVSSPPVCSGTPATVTATPSPAGTYSYVWTVPSGVTNPGNVASFTTSIAGSYSVITTNTVSSCPSQSASTNVVINPKPIVTVSSPPVCVGTPATVTATPNPIGTYTYVWTVPSGATNPGNVSTFTTSIAGTYSVIITDVTTGCSSQPASTTVVINPIPIVTVSSPPICTGTLATVTATANPSGTYTYVWTVPSGATNPGNVSTFTTSIAGTYSVIITNATTSCPSQPASTTVVINPIPTVTVSSPPVCSGTPATVTATPNPAGTYSYVWTVPSGVTNPGNVASFATSIAGTYSVVATNTSSNCPSQPASTVVVINPKPTVSVTSSPVCSGTLATVTAIASPAGTYTYVWTVPSGATNPGNVPNFTTSIVGVYSVTVTNTATTCPSQPALTTVIINPIPTVTVNSPPVCSGTLATVAATVSPSGSYSYVWSVPSGVTNPGNVANFTTSVVGIYSVVATNTTTGCPSQAASSTVFINPTPTVTVTSPPVCLGVPATVTATPNPIGTYTYVWTVPAGVTNPGNVANFITTVAGIYSVIITNTTTSCPSQPASTTVIINPIPTVSVSSPPVCSGTPATVTANPSPAGSYSYVWTVPSGVTNPGNVSTFQTSIAGTYTVIATNTSSICISQPASVTVTINTTPTVTVISPPVCSGTPASVTATSNPAGTYTYVWTVPSGASDPGNVATFTTTVAGLYSVIATSTTTACPSQPSSTSVVINPIPTVTVSSPPVCSGIQATVSAIPNPAGNYSYVWTVPSGATDPGNVATFNTTIAGSYNVIITNTGTNCPSPSATGIVVINPIPNAGNSSSLPICSNQDPVDLFPLLGSSAQVGGTWTDPSNVVVSNILNPATAVSGIYTYTVTGITPCPDSMATVTVTITPGPEAGNNSTFSICANSVPYDLFTLLGPNAQAGGTWTNPSNAVVSNTFNPATDIAGDYTYTLTGTNPCDNDHAVITIITTPIPNAGTDSSPTICTNAGSVDLFTYLGGTPQTGGVWTNSGGTTISNIFDPTVNTSGVYTYTVTGGFGCSPASANITVIVLQSPIAGADGALPTCPNITSLDLNTGLDGTQGSGTWNDDDATGALVNNIFNPSTVGVGTYHFTYTVGGGTAPCLSDTALVIVTVNPLPNAGNAVTISPVCTSVGTVDLNALLTGQDPGGTWTDVNSIAVTSPIDISNFAEGSYTYTYTVSNACGTVFNPNVQFTVLPNPQIVSSNIAITPVCIGSDVMVNFTGMIDGTYVLNYDLSGSNVLVGQTVTITVTGGAASFTIPTATVPASGATTITFNTIQNSTTTCLVSLNNVIGNIIINPIVQINDSNISVAGVCLGSNATVAITNAINLPDGTYQFGYTIPTGTTTAGNSGDVAITGGNGQFSIPSTIFGTVGNYSITINSITTTTGCSNLNVNATTNFTVVTQPHAGTFTGIVTVCPSTGVFNLNTLLFEYDSNGIWTDNATSQVVTSPITIINFAPGTYTYTYTVHNACGDASQTVQFTVLPSPHISTLNINPTAICIGENAIINLNGMVDGVYTLNYDLTGSNPLANQQATVTISAGIGNFIIPSTSLPNVGTTVITYNSIINTSTSCSNLLAGVATTIVVKPLAHIDSTNLSIANACLGNNIVVNISGAINLPDAVYQFNYSIPGATPTSANSGNVTITGGIGQFTIPAASFTVGGNYTLTVFGIIAPTGCTNPNENATVNFTINSLPNVTGATVSAQTTCPNFASTVTISGASNLVDGVYSLTYQLSGANTSSATVLITFAGGVGSFSIPATDLVNNGDTIITVNQLSSGGACGITGNVFPPYTLSITTLGTPVLVTDGGKFCLTDLPSPPTIANLSANIVSTPTVLWYNAPTGGTAYSTTDLLVDGTTYYATLVTVSGCESAVRLAVTVDLAGCNTLVFPDGFSPNGDGINDEFVITNLATMYPNFKLEIYNRYGNLVYRGDINTPNWGGTTTEAGLNLGNNLLPTGVYFYIVYFNDGTRSPKQDRVYLSR